MSHPGLQRETLDEMFSVAYEELRRLAASVRRDDPGATLSPTALVNEAWLKLANSPGLQPASRLHFKRIAARAMRHRDPLLAQDRNTAAMGRDPLQYILLALRLRRHRTASCTRSRVNRPKL